MVTSSNTESRFRVYLRACSAISLVLFLGALIIYHVHNYIFVSEVKSRLARLSDGVAQTLSHTLNDESETVRKLAEELSTGEMTEEHLIEHFIAVTRSDSLVIEAGIAWRPGRSPDGRRLSALHYGLREGKWQPFHIEDSYDYTEAEWYRDGLDSGPIWGAPYFGEATQQWVVGYMVPLRLAGTPESAPPDAIVRVNYSMNGVRRLLTELPLGSEGYASITRQGSVRTVYHPREDYIRNKKTFYEIAGDIGDSTLVTLADPMARGERGMIGRPALMTGEIAWNFYRPIEGTDWSLVVLFIRDEMMGSARQDIRAQIVVLLFFILFVSLLTLQVFRVETGQPFRLWASASLVALYFFVGIGAIWDISFDPRLQNDLQRGMIYNANSLKLFQEEQKTLARERGEPEPIFIPTGLFIHSVRMERVSEIIVQGTVWQQIADEHRDSVTWGVSFPSALTQKVEEIYRHEADDHVTIGWKFGVQLHQQFDFSRYPLDHQNMRFDLSRKDFDRNVILVPDISAYHSLIPQTLPGVDQDFNMVGWDIEKSFFNQRFSSFNTNFGIKHFVGGVSYPDLAYNMIIRRHFISPFISNVVPLFLIAGIAFALLMMITGDKDRIQSYDARGGRVTGTSGALFFAVLLAHIRLRNELTGLSTTIYIEYFYFTMYVACLAIVADVLAVASRRPPQWIQYRDNFLPKILFWPVLIGAFLASTLWFFY